MLTEARKGIRFEDQNSPQQQRWKYHRDLLGLVPLNDVQYRACIGNGMVPNPKTIPNWIHVGNKATGIKTMVRNEDLQWVSIVDIPRGHFRLAKNKQREVHWATCRPLSCQYGLPRLLNTVGRAWDFRMMPFDKAIVDTERGSFEIVNSPDVLPASEIQLFDAFNAIEMAMTSTAFFCRPPWKKHLDQFYAHLGVQPVPGKRHLLFGHKEMSEIQRVDSWIPRPYLGFEENSWKRLFGRAVPDVLFGELRQRRPLDEVVDGIQLAFLEAVANKQAYRAKFDGRVVDYARETYKSDDGSQPIDVIRMVLEQDVTGHTEIVRFSRKATIRRGNYQHFSAGEVIADERIALPTGWHTWSDHDRWDKLPLTDASLRDYMHLWFDRQMERFVDGYVHLPARLAAPAAIGSAIESQLLWDVEPAMQNYYREDITAFIFPTHPISEWHEHRWVFPAEFYADFTPNDDRFVPYEDKKRKQHG